MRHPFTYLYAFLKGNVAAYMLFLALVTLGVISFFRLPLELLPSTNPIGFTLLTRYPGHASAGIEKIITKPLEEALSSLSGLEELYSVSEYGLSRIHLTFSKNTAIKHKAIEIREKTHLVASTFARDIQKPVLIPYDPTQQPVFIVSFYQQGLSLKKLRTKVDRQLKKHFEKIEGVSEIQVSGGLERELTVYLDQGKLAAYGINQDRVIQAIQYDNIDLPLGQLPQGKNKLLATSLGRYTHLKDIAQVVVKRGEGGQVIRVGDIAQVRDANKPIESKSTLNGNERIVLYIQKSGHANGLLVANQIKQTLKTHSQDLTYDIVFDASEKIVLAVKQLMMALGLAGLIASLLLYLFYRSFKVWLIVLTVLLASSVPTFFGLFLAQHSINILTIAGLALGVGMLLDSTIVVLKANDSLTQLSPFSQTRASFKLLKPLMASTLSTIIIFLPLFLSTNKTTLMFRPLATTIAFSLMFSTIFSIVLLPSLIKALFGSSPFLASPRGAWLAAFQNGYIRVLTYFNKRRILLFGSFFILVFFSFIFYHGIKKEYFDPLKGAISLAIWNFRPVLL